MAVADLKTGYHLGHADILILKGISQELMRRREAADKPFAYARRLVRIADGGVERWRITQTEAENSEGLLYRNEITKLFAEPPLTNAEREELQRYRAAKKPEWVSVNDTLPDPTSDKRVCAYTPSEHADLQYRSLPASLFKAVCRDATHWHYFTVPGDEIVEPLPVVPDEIDTNKQAKDLLNSLFHEYPADPAEITQEVWNACRAAMIQLSGHRFSDAILNVINERQRQINAEGWTPKHDDKHTDGALALAASCYAYVAAIQSPGSGMSYKDWPKLKFWPWDEEWWKPTDPRRDLVKAAALIIAEIERIDRSGSEGGSHD